MGQLIGLELHNFKSYKGTHNVGFGNKHFISIVGPNGSGKSNMMDAISFVLGIRSSHLRSNALVDLIYRGRMDEKTAEEDSNPDSAYVKAFYRKTINEEEANEEEDIVEFMRTIHNTGDSTYNINGNVVSFKEYNRILEGESILVKARNFLVFQGDVEQIASQSSLELTKLFEQVSGSIQYQREYERLKEEYKAATADYNEALKSKRKMQTDLKSFKEGVQKEEQYKNLLAERSKLNVQYVLWQLYHLQEKRNELTSSLKSSRSQLSSLKSKLANEESILNKTRSLLAKEELAITRRKELIFQRQHQLTNLNAKLLPVNSAKQGVQKRISNLENRIASLQRDIDRQESYVAQFQNQLKVVNKANAAVEKEIKSSASGKFNMSEADLHEYESLKESYLCSGGFDLEGKLTLLHNKKEELVEELRLVKKKVEISKARISKELKVDHERLEFEVAETSKTLNDKNALHSKKSKEWKKVQTTIESANNKEYELNFKLKEILVKLDDLSATQRETNKERKLRENVATLRRLFPGVKGLVHDLCKPKKDKYAVALAPILGKNFDAVIVDSFSVAQQCISYLKKQRAGVVSFIPLDTIDTHAATLPAGNLKGCILTINTLDYDPALEKAMQYICSDTIICDDIAIAKELKWVRGVKAKLITLDGSLIHRAGLMTGGISKNSTNRWDKEEYQSLLLLKEKVTGEISELVSQLRQESMTSRDLENEVSMLSTEISTLRTHFNQLNRSLSEKITEINYHENMINDEYSPKVASLDAKLKAVDEELSLVNGEKAKLQETIYKEFSARLGFTIKDYEQHTGETVREHSKELQHLQKQLATIQNKLDFEKDRLESTKLKHGKALNNLAKVKQELEELEKQKSDIKTEIERVELQLSEERNEVEELQVKLKKKSANIKLLDESINEFNDSIQVCKKDMDALKEDIEKIGIEKVNLLKNCKMSNVELPLDNSVLDELPIERIDTQTIELANSIAIDYSLLPAKYKESNNNVTRVEFEKSIKEVEENLRALQPNSKALERFDEAKHQFNSVAFESEKLKDIERRSKEKYFSIKDKRVAAFMACYNHVTDHIDKIYRELTRNPGSSAELAGGSASLTLEDEDEPFLGGVRYHATPPMKRFKDMDYLSGGEKTMAALALLFAINSYQPSPFFILDEVDAALDVTNVERIAAYIKRHASPTIQFIVISLKSNLFSKSQSVAGVFRNQRANSSMVVTTDLTQYSDDA
ncbi:HGL023Wp [Eremothecium sinecaudum]|uniref:Structural maintenance of chromosomes protein n=1 Tax=Eremothecium sinecaudum TaxID=45286 RepID=A0A0X8HVN9_9SACH|nr:HGL023Wp [Eremothecium sinecaudum]AMD22317.1 HGL023Wp [Eremothecium sinecaudum]